MPSCGKLDVPFIEIYELKSFERTAKKSCNLGDTIYILSNQKNYYNNEKFRILLESNF